MYKYMVNYFSRVSIFDKRTYFSIANNFYSKKYFWFGFDIRKTKQIKCDSLYSVSAFA